MRIRTPADLGALIRQRRRELGLAALGKRIGVSRQWGHRHRAGPQPRPAGLVLRALNELDTRLDASAAKDRDRATTPVDIDAIVSTARKARR
jgi:HTH-type transcriptional regulator / antitoxin HipB